MQSKREYLVSLGLAKEGRGKFSNAAKEALVKAEAEGMEFSDSSTGPTAIAPRKTRPTKNSEQSEPVGQNSEERKFPPYLTQDDYRFPEADWKAIGVDGKTYGMRECCNTCKVSLVGHFCDSPTILDNIVVHIRPVKRAADD